MPSARLRRRVFAALLLIALPTTIVAAPIPGLPAVAAAQTTEEAKPADLMVPARDIPAQADTDERLARDVQAQAQDRRQLDELRARLDVIMKSVLRLASQLRGTNLLDLPATRLEALERRWMFYQRELESWRRDQQVSVDSNADEAAQIASRREAWEATIAPPNREDVVAALVVRANRRGSARSTDVGAARDGPSRDLCAVEHPVRSQGGPRRHCELRSAPLAHRLATALAGLERGRGIAERAVGGHGRRRRRPAVPR
jgi:hypothetical protein